MNTEYKVLRWILMVSGMFLMCAFAAMLLRVETMRIAHKWLGLGGFPVAPITDYLTRSTSMLYGVHGSVMFYTGLTIQHHWRFVWLLGWLHIVIGVSLVVIDSMAPMPMYWTLLEGPSIAALGVLILVLFRRGSPPEPLV